MTRRFSWPAGVRSVGIIVLLSVPDRSVSAQRESHFGYRLTARTDGAYETNPQFTPGGGDSFSTRAGVGTELRYGTKHTSAALAASGNGSRYNRVATLNRYGYLFRADVTSDVTPRLTTRATASLVRSLAREVNVAALGLSLFPLSVTRSREATMALSYRADPRSTFDVGANYDNVVFPDRFLPGGSLLAGHLGVRHRYSVTGDLGLQYRIDRNSLSGGIVDVQSAVSSWQQSRGSSGARIAIGAARLESSAMTGHHWRAIGDAELVQRFPVGVVGMRYGRSVSQVYGLGGVLASDLVSVDYGILSRRRVKFGVEAHRGWFSDPAVAGTRGAQLTSSGAALFLGRPIGRTFGIESQLFARRTTGRVTIPNRGALVGFTYSY